MKQYFDKLYAHSMEQFYQELETKLIHNNKTFIVTANPETFMLASHDQEFSDLLLDNNTTIVPDGIGIVKAAKMLNYPITERIPGIEIAQTLLTMGNQHKKTIYLFGASAEVMNALQQKIKETFPHLMIVGYHDGYTENKSEIFEDIILLQPDIILVALGIPHQEKLIYQHLHKFNKGIFVGVGGSFDVMSGMKKRAPHIFQKLNLEWCYRLIKEPKRIKRFYNSNVKFIFQIKKLKKKGSDL